ncbi:MAG: hypothetical protein V3W32_10025 [Gemmatimonadota bacterium]
MSKRQGGVSFGDPRSERPAVKGRPSRIEGTARIQRPGIERPYRPERTARLERPYRPERTAQIERPYRPERTAQIERPNRPERTTRLERPYRPERTARLERPYRPERTTPIEWPYRDRLQTRHWYPSGWHGYGRAPFFHFPHRHRYGRSHLFGYRFGAGCYFDKYGYTPFGYGVGRYFGSYGYRPYGYRPYRYGPYGYGAFGRYFDPYGYGYGLNFGFRFGFHDFIFGANYGWPGSFGCGGGAFFGW